MSDIPIQARKYSISIEYCVPCDYSSQLIAITDELVRDYQHVIDHLDLIMGTKGKFDVKVDDNLIFSKAEQKRLPEKGEILSLFQDAIGTKIKKYPRD